MIAPGFANVEVQLWIWLIAMIRPGAAFIAAPVFGAPAVPLQLRLILSLALGMAALNSVHIQLPADGVASLCSAGSMNAAVLPLPVCADTIRS